MRNARSATDPPETLLGCVDRPGLQAMPPKRRRVLVLSEIIAPYRIPVFNALAQQERIELHVVFLAETDAALRQWRVYKDEIRFSYEVLPSWRLRAGKHKLLLNWGLRSRLKKFAPETIICGGYNYFASWEALSWARRHGVDFVLWSESNRHDARSGSEWVESLKAYFLLRCDRFVVPGKSSLSYLQSLGMPREKISLAPNAVNNRWFSAESGRVRQRAPEVRAKLGLPDHFILYAGRLVREKGIFDLLTAYGKLADNIRSETALVFAGDGECRPELEHEAKRVCPGTVCFTGFVHREELAAYYALAEALVLPTHSDTWGLVANEAMACGLPIIVASAAGSAADLVEHGWNGYVVAPCDPEALKEAMEAVLMQPELRQQMSMRSSERIQMYSPEACAGGLAAAAFSAGTPNPEGRGQ